jgi:hypothetical protein
VRRRGQHHPQRARRRDIPDLAAHARRALQERDQAARKHARASTVPVIVSLFTRAGSLPFLLHTRSCLAVSQISGDIVAPESPQDWGQGQSDQWLHFHKVRDLTVTGGGIIDGRGQQWWAQSLARAQPAPKVSLRARAARSQGELTRHRGQGRSSEQQARNSLTACCLLLLMRLSFIRRLFTSRTARG